MKIKDVTLNNLKVLLQAIPREELYSEEAQSVTNKWQALTARSKIVGLIKEANKALEEKMLRADEILKEFREDHKMLAAEYEPQEKKDEKPEDRKERLKEKAKAENALNSRIDEKIKKDTGLKLYWFAIGQNQYVFPRYAEEGSEQEVEIKFDPKHKHLEFLREQIENNMFSMRVEDEILAELHEVFSV